MIARVLPLAAGACLIGELSGLPVSSWLIALGIPILGTGLIAVMLQADRVAGMLTGVGVSLLLASLLLPLLTVMAREVLREETFQLVAAGLAAAFLLPPLAKALLSVLPERTKQATPRLPMKRRTPRRLTAGTRKASGKPPVVDVFVDHRSEP
jgi:hypothetical protein